MHIVNASDLLREQNETLLEQARELERYRERARLLKLANDCDSIETLRKQLTDLLTASSE